MKRGHVVERLLRAARSADDPARRVVDALVDDPLFAGWAAAEAGAELETPQTLLPGQGQLVVHASGEHAGAMASALERLLGQRPRSSGPAGAEDRLLTLLSRGGSPPRVTARPRESLALVLGDPGPEAVALLEQVGAVVRYLGEDRGVLASVQREARASGYTPVVLHRHLQGSAGAAGRGLARAARAVAGGMGQVQRPACLLMVGQLHATGAGAEGAPAAGIDPVAEVEEAALRALRAGGAGIEVGAVEVGSGDPPRVLGLALVE